MFNQRFSSYCAGKKTNEIKVDKPIDMLQYVMLEAKVGELDEATEIYVDMDGVRCRLWRVGKDYESRSLFKIDNVDINDALQNT